MRAHAKINLALVVGPTRDDGKHEVVTVLQRIDLVDDVHVARTDRAGIEVTVSGAAQRKGGRRCGDNPHGCYRSPPKRQSRGLAQP